jgi:sec-independent protein translocase protein TatA
MGISIWQLLIILLIVLLLFGAKRLKNLGGDLGESIKSFRKSMREEENAPNNEQLSQKKDERVIIEGEATKEKEKA